MLRGFCEGWEPRLVQIRFWLLIDRERKWAVCVDMETLVGWICPSRSTHAKVGCRPPICHPDRSVPGFPATRHSPADTCAAFSKESRMKFANATNLNRKSGVAQ